MLSIIPALLFGAVLSSSAGAASVTTSFKNANQYQFDTNGNAIDLTSAKIDKLGDTYLWYGLPFGCGEAFCGITSYSSSDLLSWTFNGFLFDPTTPEIQTLCAADLGGNCGRPHIIFSQVGNEFVLWVNAGAPGYVLFTSSNLISGYVQLPDRALLGFQPPGPFQGGDFSVQIIDGVGYIAYSLIDFSTLGASIWPPFLQNIYFQELTPDMKNTTGNATLVTSAAEDLVDNEAESPDIFKRGDFFYVTASNTCGFCTGTVLVVYRSTSITGPWKRQIITGDTCGGQTTGVLTLPSPDGASTSYLHVADLFATSPLAGIRTGAHGHQIQQLHFNADGSLQDLNCHLAKSVSVTFTAGTRVSTEGRATTATDSSGQDASFNPVCDLPANSLYQTWASSKSGTLSEVGVNIAGDLPSGNTTITLFRYQNNTNFFTPRFVWETLATSIFTPAQISSSFQVLRLPSNAAVATGDRLGLAITTMSVTPLCRLAKVGNNVMFNVDTSTRTLFANGPGQVSLRGKRGNKSPVVVLAGEELKWYAIVK